MRTNRVAAVLFLITTTTMCVGCGAKKEEAQNRERIELEEKSRREAEAANKAITDVNRRMFQKKKSVPVETAPAPNAEASKQPATEAAPPPSAP